MKKLKVIIKNRFPRIVALVLLREFTKEYLNYIKYSGIRLRDSDNSYLGKIIAVYHVIEKGLTMPEPRMGFGQHQVVLLARLLRSKCQVPHLSSHPQFIHAAKVLNEYLDFHERHEFTLEKDMVDLIRETSKKINHTCAAQYACKSDSYFLHANAGFGDFSKSRKSVRCFSENKVGMDVILNAVEIANTSPSSCNRQTSRVHAFYERKDIDQLLEFQAGSRGWGNRCQCLLVVTGDISLCHNVYEQDLVKVDGGMYAMSLIYALHHLKIAACPLNCYMPRNREKAIKSFAGIPVNQNLVVMIACGYPSDDMTLALSPRRAASEVLFTH